jgi:hypothetical protein
MSPPIARPIAHFPAPGAARAGAAFREISARKDCAPARPSRISARQLDRIASEVSALDLEVLAFVGTYRLVTGKQLVRRFWLTADADMDRRARVGRRALKRLSDWRVLDRLPGRARGGVRGGSDTLIYCVGVVGAKLLARHGLATKRLGKPSERLTAHTLTICELAVRLHEARATLECIETRAEPECWFSFLGPMLAALWVKPDLYLRVALPGGEWESRWLCELDMGSENKGTLLAKSRRYIDHYRSGSFQRDHGVYPKVLWIVPDSQRATQLKEILRQLPADGRRLFAICRFDEAIEFLVTETRS